MQVNQNVLSDHSCVISSDLDKTCDRYLRSQKAILSNEEYQKTEQVVAEFRGGAGPGLQDQLKKIDKVKDTKVFLHLQYMS